MMIIAPESTNDRRDGDCPPASNPIKGARNTNAIARIGKAMLAAGGFVVATIVLQDSVGEEIFVTLAKSAMIGAGYRL